MSIINEQVKLHPKNTAVQIKAELFTDCPDHAPLMDKLEKEHAVIIIEQRPDGRGLSSVDHEMYEFELPQEYVRYMSYYLTIKPTFETFYKSEYVKQRSTTSTLTDNNRALITDIMRAIDDEVSLTGNTDIQLSPIQSDELSTKGLEFLKKIQAIESYEPVDDSYWNDDYERELPSGTVAYFKVKINLPTFDEVYAELSKNDIAETLVAKPRQGTNDMPIEYDDEHAIATYKGKTNKLFETGTIMSVLTQRVFRADGARINATDILLAIDDLRIDPDKEKTTKTLTNAKDRINISFNKLFGINDVICYEKQQFWLNVKYCSVKSPYKTASSGN